MCVRMLERNEERCECVAKGNRGGVARAEEDSGREVFFIFFFISFFRAGEGGGGALFVVVVVVGENEKHSCKFSGR